MRATIARDWPNWGDRFAPKKVCGYGTPPAPDDGGAVMNREIELREAACRSGGGGAHDVFCYARRRDHRWRRSWINCTILNLSPPLPPKRSMRFGMAGKSGYFPRR